MKKLIFFFTLILMITTVSAVSPFETSSLDFDNGITIFTPSQYYFQSNVSHTFNFQAFNTTDGTAFTNVTANCSFFFINDSGNMDFMNPAVGFIAGSWKQTLTGGNFTIGHYNYGIKCVDLLGDIGGMKPNDLRVTNSGIDHEETDGFLILSVIFLIVLGGLFFVGFIKEDKIQVKWSLFIIGFLFLLAALNTISATIHDNFIDQTLISLFDGITAYMFIIFWISAGLLAVLWFLTILRAILFQKSMKQAAKFGGLMK